LPHKDLKSDILSRIDFATFYAKHTKDLKHTTGDNYLGLCPFHEDSIHPSFAVNLKNGLWQCKAGCGEGDVFHYAGKLCNLDAKTNFPAILNYVANEIGIDVKADVPKSNIQKVANPKKPDTSKEETVKCADPLPQSLVDTFKANLTPELKHKLAQKRGLNECTLDRFDVGYCLERQRYSIPIRNTKGDIVTIRLYDPDPQAFGKMINYVEKRGDKLYTWTDKSQLLGLKDIAAANSQRIIICEGEFDCMMLWEKGFPAITGVTGGSAWDKEWEKHLKDKDVVLLYDSDKPGKEYALKHGARLKSKRIAKTVKIADLPLPGTKPDKDVTDWFAKDHKTSEELQAVIDAAVEPPDVPSEPEEPETPEPSGDGGDRDRPPPDDENDPGEQFYGEDPWKPDDGEMCPADVADMFIDSKGCRDESGLLFRKWKNDYWQFNGKIFKRILIDEVRESVIQFIKTVNRNKSRRTFAMDVIANLDAEIRVPKDLNAPIIQLSSSPVNAKGLMALNNGVIDLNSVINEEEVVLMPHSSDRLMLYSLPFDFDLSSTCPTWERFLSEVILDSNVRNLLQEYCGYMLTESLGTLGYNYQKFLLCIGTGRNGKSTFLETIREMLGGTENVSTVSLSEFGDKFKIAGMLNKVANISGEMGDIEKIPEERLKAIVGGDNIDIEEKYKPSASAKLTSKLIFASNHVPRFRDRTLGLWRKMIIISFNVTIDAAREDAQLGMRLKNELPGILNWSLSGLRRLFQRGHFNEPESCTVAKEEMSTEISSAKRFLRENYIFNPTSPERLSCLELYRKYSEWCRERNLKPFADSQFGKEVLSVFGLDRTRGRIEGRRSYFYIGIVENEDEDPPSYVSPVDDYNNR